MINRDGINVFCAMANITNKSQTWCALKAKQSEVLLHGCQTKEKSPGVMPGRCNLDGVGREDWNCIVNAVKCCKHVFYSYADTGVMAHISEARHLVP